MAKGPAPRDAGADAGFMPRDAGRSVVLGLALAGILAAFSGFFLPRVPGVWHMHLLSPGWMPHQIVKLLEFSNDIQVALLAERPPEPHPDIALVLITEDTLANLAYITPIDRRLIAQLVKSLDHLGARAIGLDILFDQATEPIKDAELLERFKLTRAALILGGADERTPLSTRRRAWQTEFMKTAGLGFGFFNLRYDVREAAQSHIVRNRAAPAPGSRFKMSFAEALAHATGARSFPESRRIPWLRAPAGRDTFLAVDADAVLAAESDPSGLLARTLEDQLNGRIVLVGVDMLGRDRHPTPLSAVEGDDMLGVAVHAQILAGLLDGRSLVDLDRSGVSALATVATFLGFVLGWFAARRRIVATLLVGGGIVLLMGVSALVLWQFKAIVPVAAVVAAFVGAAMAGRLIRAYGVGI
ncbi:MAG: CHASE2 domain-containing protein [Hyphomicrobiaceae bacterium]